MMVLMTLALAAGLAALWAHQPEAAAVFGIVALFAANRGGERGR